MLTVEYVKNLKWNDSEHTSFTCIVKYSQFNEEHPSNIVPHDIYDHIKQIWQNGINGVYGPIQEYDPQSVFEGVVYTQNEKVPVTTLGDAPQT